MCEVGARRSANGSTVAREGARGTRALSSPDGFPISFPIDSARQYSVRSWCDGGAGMVRDGAIMVRWRFEGGASRRCYSARVVREGAKGARRRRRMASLAFAIESSRRYAVRKSARVVRRCDGRAMVSCWGFSSNLRSNNRAYILCDSGAIVARGRCGNCARRCEGVSDRQSVRTRTGALNSRDALRCYRARGKYSAWGAKLSSAAGNNGGP